MQYSPPLTASQESFLDEVILPITTLRETFRTTRVHLDHGRSKLIALHMHCYLAAIVTGATVKMVELPSIHHDGGRIEIANV